jgi:hypothetical protein
MELALGLGQRDPQRALAPPLPLEQELETDRGLAGAGRPFDQVQVSLRQSAAEDLIETGDTGRIGATHPPRLGRCLISVATAKLATLNGR